MDRCTQASSRGICSTGAREAARIVLSSRKTWKMMRSTTEQVWPPYIEAALVAGLEAYRPESAKDIRQLQRFPKRNCWISQYIKKHTNCDRTPKQVGSRLQQLRDSCHDEQILYLLNRKDYGDAADAKFVFSPESASASELSSSSASPSPDTSAEPCQINYAPTLEAGPHTIVHVNLSSSSTDAHVSSLRTSCTLHLAYSYIAMDAAFASWKHPTIGMYSSQFLEDKQHHCLFNVFLDNGLLAHVERTHMTFQLYTGENSYFYTTQFPPRFWPTFFSAIKMSRCRVSQQIVRRRPIGGKVSLSLEQDAEDQIVHTIFYRFSDGRTSTLTDSSLTDSSSSIVHTSTFPMITRGADVLGLDVPVFSAKVEPPSDGRAHFPMQAISSLEYPVSHSSTLSSSTSQEPVPPSPHCVDRVVHCADQSCYEDSFSVIPVHGTSVDDRSSEFQSPHTSEILVTNDYPLNLGPPPPPTSQAVGVARLSPPDSTTTDEVYSDHPSTFDQSGWEQQQRQWSEHEQMYPQHISAPTYIRGNEPRYFYPHPLHGSPTSRPHSINVAPSDYPPAPMEDQGASYTQRQTSNVPMYESVPIQIGQYSAEKSAGSYALMYESAPTEEGILEENFGDQSFPEEGTEKQGSYVQRQVGKAPMYEFLPIQEEVHQESFDQYALHQNLEHLYFQENAYTYAVAGARSQDYDHRSKHLGFIHPRPNFGMPANSHQIRMCS